MSIDDYSQQFADAGNQYGVNPDLLRAIALQESSGNPNAIGPDTSSGNAKGLMQLTDATAKSLGVDPNDPKQAIVGAARLLSGYQKQFPDQNSQLMAYYGGPNTSQWGSDTKAYPAQVLKHLSGNASASNQPMDEDEQIADAAIARQKAKLVSNPTSASASSNMDEDESIADAAIQRQKDKITIQANEAKANPSLSSQYSTDVNTAANRIADSFLQGRGAGDNFLDTAGAVGSGLSSAIGQTASHFTPDLVKNALTSASGSVQAAAQNVADAAGSNVQQFGSNRGVTPTSNSGEVLGNALMGAQNLATSGYNSLSPDAQRRIDDATDIAKGSASMEGVKAASEGVGNALNSGAKALINPSPTYSKLTNVIKTAPDVLGAEVPTQMFASTGGPLQRSAAQAFDTSDLESGINKKLVQLTGANDAGASHTVLDADAFEDAIKNAGNEYDNLHKAIGPVSVEKNYNAISDAFDSVSASDQGLFNGIKKDFLSKLDNNAQLSASDIKGLTGWKSDLDRLSNSQISTVSIPAQKIKSLLEDSVLDAATPEQATQYKALDNKYKLLKAMEPISNNLGAAPKIDPAAISKAANRSYNKLTGVSNPIQDFRYSLNTLYPNGSAISNVLPEATGLPGGNLLSGQEIAYGLVSGNPQAIALGTATRTAPKIANKISSSIVNSDWYRNKLLQNSGYVNTP